LPEPTDSEVSGDAARLSWTSHPDRHAGGRVHRWRGAAAAGAPVDLPGDALASPLDVQVIRHRGDAAFGPAYVELVAGLVPHRHKRRLPGGDVDVDADVGVGAVRDEGRRSR
jgi:hypothetical protein